ncbi:MAG: RHS domain-containing protein [Acidobacteria bacterium]|nr:RHS domain-containing protein [Acidobacteriota bacterium]
MTNIVSPADSTTIGFTYDDANRPETRTFPNGVTTTYTFDRMSRLTRLTDTSQTATLFDRQYEYNNANQIESVTEPGRVRNFSYDFVNRLTGMTSPTEPAESYNFDPVGNRLSSHRSANYGYEFGQFNRVNSTDTAGYVYDANGNIRMKAEGKELWRYQWDFDNRLVSASTRKQTVRYKYDALGRRIQRFIVGGKENTKFIHDGADVIADDNSGTLTKYINGPGIDNKLRMQTGSDVRYFIADHLGSTNALTDASGNVTSSAAYDSFGNATGNLATRYKFTGREYDDFTGLHYYRARWYDSNLGRFISEDPIGFAGGDVNLYGYVWNQPLKYRDPVGTTGEEVAIASGAVLLAGEGSGIVALLAAAAPPVAIAVGGAALIYGATYVGEYTANHPSNPFVNGPLNPFGSPRPVAPPVGTTPFRSHRRLLRRLFPGKVRAETAINANRPHPPDPWPQDPPNDRDGCAEKFPLVFNFVPKQNLAPTCETFGVEATGLV